MREASTLGSSTNVIGIWERCCRTGITRKTEMLLFSQHWKAWFQKLLLNRSDTIVFKKKISTNPLLCCYFWKLPILCIVVSSLLFTAPASLPFPETMTSHYKEVSHRSRRIIINIHIPLLILRWQPENWKFDAAHMAKKIELLEASKRKLMGEGLGTCTLEELQQIENQLERSLSNIRSRKNLLFKEQIEQLKEKERILTEENANLSKKCGVQPNQETSQVEILPHEQSSQNTDVVTDLFIGRGNTRYSLRN